jgi:hypothetical protein
MPWTADAHNGRGPAPVVPKSGPAADFSWPRLARPSGGAVDRKRIPMWDGPGDASSRRSVALNAV